VRDPILRACLRMYPPADREKDGRAIVDLASELSARSHFAFLREVNGVGRGGIRAHGRALWLRLTGDPQQRRAACLGLAAGWMAFGYLLSAAGNISVSAGGRFDFGSTLVAAAWALQLCGVLLLASGFAVAATAFSRGAKDRDSRLGQGALTISGGYGLAFLGRVLSLLYLLYYQSPADQVQVQASTILLMAAYLPATAAASLAGRAFSGSRRMPGRGTATRDRRLGWASIGFAVYFAVVFAHFVIISPGWTWTAAEFVALAAMGVAAAGFLAGARGGRRSSADPVADRDRILSVAAMLFLLYQLLNLTHAGSAASWLWRLASVALFIAAVFAAAGLMASRRALLRRGQPFSVAGDR
jgi:hypothetical protein